MARVERDLFILTRSAFARRSGFDLVFWAWSEEGPVKLRFGEREAVFFVDCDAPTRAGRRAEVELTSLSGRPVDAVYFTDRREMKAEAARLREAGTPGHETDVKIADRFLMERFITGGCAARGEARARDGFIEMVDPTIRAADVRPTLRVSSFDVESEGTDGPLISVAIVTGEGDATEERVFARGAGPPVSGVRYFDDELSALSAFLDYVQQLDPDVLIGWNVIDFDVAYLEERARRLGLRFSLGRDGERGKVLRGTRNNAPSVALVPGRVVLDGIATMRAATWSFESFALDDVAAELLGRQKKIHVAPGGDKLQEILRMYREDLPALIEYNLEDCRLVRDIFSKAHVLDFAIERQRLTGLTMDRRAGAVSAFDNLYLPRLHRHGRVAKEKRALTNAKRSPGGHVMDSVPGLYRNVLVLDFKSLYPSIIRTFKVDPLGLAIDDDDAVEGFLDARFSRRTHILPELIEQLWAARDEAKRAGDAALSRAIKIQMNSFYGVLGSPTCRFFDPRLATSITRRGHEVLRGSRAFIEEAGYRVIYGDTDSLFVLVGEDASADASLAIGRELERSLNAMWRARVREEHGVDCALEVELETLYHHFLMPTMRGSDIGSKKRYAGVRTGSGGDAELVFKGLEAVRTDWTRLARDFQRELVRRVFADEPYAAYVRDLSDRLFRGELDDALVYRKRLRRALDDYERNVPPHVAAARQLDRAPKFVRYVITTRGPEPVERQRSAIDYDHYLNKQLAPAADVILPFLGESFARLGGRQLNLGF